MGSKDAEGVGSNEWRQQEERTRVLEGTEKNSHGKSLKVRTTLEWRERGSNTSKPALEPLLSRQWVPVGGAFGNTAGRSRGLCG